MSQNSAQLWSFVLLQSQYLNCNLILLNYSDHTNDHIYRMVKESNSNIWPNQTIVSDQSERMILLCQLMIIYVGY